MKRPEEFLMRGNGQFINCTDYDDAIQAMKDYANEVVKNESLPLSKLGDFVDWIRDRKFTMYSEGWCQQGGNNGWHCSTVELIKLFNEECK